MLNTEFMHCSKAYYHIWLLAVESIHEEAGNVGCVEYFVRRLMVLTILHGSVNVYEFLCHLWCRQRTNALGSAIKIHVPKL